MESLVFALIFLLTATSCAAAGPVREDAGSVLRKWGLAYCLSKALPEGGAQDDAERSMGAYFELGRHDSESAYAAVRDFFDVKLARSARISKESDVDLALVPCLDSYESNEYRMLIRALDRFVGR